MDTAKDLRLPPRLSFPRVASSTKSLPFQTSKNVPSTAGAKTRRSPVMSLSAYCIKSLSLAEIHNISDLESCWTRRSYESATMRKAVVELLPSIPLSLLGTHKKKERKKPRLMAMVDGSKDVRLDSNTADGSTIHPQLWGLLNALIIPSTLPPILRHFSLPITDEHIPSLQTCSILSTPTLSLLTHVSFSSPESRIQITDESLLQIRTLACLTILDLSATPVKSSGILRLIASMRARLPSKVSPWRLRVMDLRRTFVDEELLLGNKSGLSIQALPMLCALDLRGTSVSSVACKAFQRSWGSTSPTPPQLFHPTPAGLMAETMSRLINERNAAIGNSMHGQCEHPILLLDRLHHPHEQPKYQPIQSKPHESRPTDLKLRANTSGVLVLTNTATILGNVSEAAGNHEEGTAQASFTVNKATIAAQERDHGPQYAQKTSKGHAESGLESSFDEEGEIEGYLGGNGESEVGEGTISDQEDETSSESEADHLLNETKSPKDQLADAIEQGFVMYREPPGPSILLQLDKAPEPNQGAKKRPRSNETFQVKRFKGPPMSQILGSTPSSRRF